MSPQSSFFLVPLKNMEKSKKLRQETKSQLRLEIRVYEEFRGLLQGIIPMSSALIGCYRMKVRPKKFRRRFLLLPSSGVVRRKYKKCSVGAAARMKLAVGDV